MPDAILITILASMSAAIGLLWRSSQQAAAECSRDRRQLWDALLRIHYLRSLPPDVKD